MKISNALTAIFVSGVCLGGAHAQNTGSNDSKNTTHSTVGTSNLIGAVQTKVYNTHSTNPSRIPPAEYLHTQINASSIDDQINKEMQRQRGDLVRSSGGIVRTTDDGKSFAFGGLPANLDTTIAQNGDIKIKYTIKF